MKVLIIAVVVVVVTSYVCAMPYKPKIQIYEIHENPEWKDNSKQRYHKPNTIPSTLLPGMDLNNIDKPKMLVFEIQKNQKELLKELIRKIIKNKNEKSDQNDSQEVRKMITKRYEGDSEQYDSGKDVDNENSNEDENSGNSNDYASDFVDETRSKGKLREGNKTMLRSARRNIVIDV